jgi:hypothetical protein
MKNVELRNTVLGSGRVPHVRPSVHGPETDFSNAFTPCIEMLVLGRSLFAGVVRALEGAAPRLFRPMYAQANRGTRPERWASFFAPTHLQLSEFSNPRSFSIGLILGSLTSQALYMAAGSSVFPRESTMRRRRSPLALVKPPLSRNH